MYMISYTLNVVLFIGVTSLIIDCFTWSRGDLFLWSLKVCRNSIRLDDLIWSCTKNSYIFKNSIPILCESQYANNDHKKYQIKAIQKDVDSIIKW